MDILIYGIQDTKFSTHKFLGSIRKSIRTNNLSSHINIISVDIASDFCRNWFKIFKFIWMNEFYILLFYKDRSCIVFYIDPKKLLIEYAAILYVAIWNRERAVTKKKLFNPSRRNFSKQFRISWFDRIYRSVQTKIVKKKWFQSNGKKLSVSGRKGWFFLRRIQRICVLQRVSKLSVDIVRHCR